MIINLTVSYETIKPLIGVIPSYYIQQGDGGYELYVSGDQTFTKCHLGGSDTANISDFEANLKSKCKSVPSPDDAYLSGLIANSVPMVAPRTEDGRIRSATEKTNYGSRSNFYSHNWCDPTTWYSGSTYVSNETAVDSGDHLTYTLTHNNVIDVYHGKITLEDGLRDSSGRDYRVHVTVNGTAKTEQDPHNEYCNRVLGKNLPLGDFTVNYSAGSITFLSALEPTDVVQVTYHYAGSSIFKVSPASGKKLTVVLAEVQLSTPIEPQDSIILEFWGIADFFLTSAQMTAYGIPAGIGYKIKLSSFVYKSINDFQNDAMRAYSKYDPMGSAENWRALPNHVTVFDWDYVKSDAIQSTKGMEARVYLQHDTPFDGTMATVTFYCVSEPDV